MTNGFRHKLAITYFEVNSRFGVVIGSQILIQEKLFLIDSKSLHVLSEQIVAIFPITARIVPDETR